MNPFLGAVSGLAWTIVCRDAHSGAYRRDRDAAGRGGLTPQDGARHCVARSRTARAARVPPSPAPPRSASASGRRPRRRRMPMRPGRAPAG